MFFSWDFLGLLRVFYFQLSGLNARKVSEILDDFEVFLGISKRPRTRRAGFAGEYKKHCDRGNPLELVP